MLRDAIFGRRRDAKTPVTLLLEVETYEHLQERADEYAGAHGVARTDIVWGELVARHIAESLEAAYLSSPAEESPIPPGVNLTMLVVSLSATVAQQLRGHAREAASRLGVDGPEALEEFEWRHVGRALEMAYKARDQAGSPAAKQIVNSGDAPESFAG